MKAPTLKRHARAAEDSDAAAWGARSGLASRGLLWFVIGLLAVRIAAGRGGTADKKGAFTALRDQPLGTVLLALLALGFAAHAIFRVLEGTVGRREEKDDKKRWLKRVSSLGRAVIYGSLAVGTVRFLTSGSGSEDNAKKPTADVMSLPAGRWIVGAVGVGLVVVGLVQGVRGVRQNFLKKLNVPRGVMRTVVKRVGAAGLLGRGLVYALIGGFLVQAAVTYQPAKAKGLDAALKTVARASFGTVLLLVTAIGMLAFAAWSFLEARYRSL